MLWADEAGRIRRPVVVIEDHLYHTGELLAAVAAHASEQLSQLAVCVLDRPGPDTDAAIADWSARYPGVRFVALEGERGRKPSDYATFAREVARLVRPGGIVLQDIQLETLSFIPADRWWESIYLGATIRGLFPGRAPVIRFCSNKRGYDATFGKDLIDAGFDPRDVLDKSEMSRVVVPTVLKLLQKQFPLMLRVAHPDGPVSAGNADGGFSPGIPVSDADRAEVERECDLLLWRTAAGVTISGRALTAPATLKPGSPEIQTWQQLIEDRIANGDGVAVLNLGERLAESGAERAEQTNLAARHVHGLRARLTNAEAVVTAYHRYRIADDLVVGLV